MCDTILETRQKKEIFGSVPWIKCSKIENLVQIGPKTKNLVFQVMKNLSRGKLVLKQTKIREQKILIFIEVKFIPYSNISESNRGKKLKFGIYHL